MELSVMPSQFLNVVMDEIKTDSNGNKKIETVTKITSLSKSMKRALETETLIIPIYTNSK